MKIIKVKTDSKNYDIKVGHDLLGSTPLKKLVSQKDILLIVDNKVPELLINKFKILVSVHPNALIPITVSVTEEV